MSSSSSLSCPKVRSSCGRTLDALCSMDCYRALQFGRGRMSWISSTTSRNRSLFWLVTVESRTWSCMPVLPENVGIDYLPILRAFLAVLSGPHQILAIFIRDVSTMPGEPLTDPTGSKWQGGQSDDVLRLISNPNAFDSNGQTLYQQHRYPATYAHRIPPRSGSSTSSVTSANPKAPVRQNTSTSITSMFGYRSADPPSTPLVTEEPSSMQSPTMTLDPPPIRSSNNVPPPPSSEGNLNAQLASLPSQVRRRIELQMRINKARDEIPPNIKFRAFKDPLECTEAEEILYSLRL